MPLPEAYRSLSRPSSPTDAKASIVRPYLLNQENLGLVGESCFTLHYAVVKEQTNRSRFKIDQGSGYPPILARYSTSSVPSGTKSDLAGLPAVALAKAGGRAWNRTRDLPAPAGRTNRFHSPASRAPRLVGVPGIEPGTSSLSGMRSNRLSYTPYVAQDPSFGSQSEGWWRQPGSNR